MEHLLQKSKCSIFHITFKYMIFQRRQKMLLWSKGLAWFAVYKTPLSQLLHMRVMATPYIFFILPININ